VSVLGVDITRRSAVDVARLAVGRSFQDPKLLDDATVLENLLLGLHLKLPYGVASQFVRRRHVARAEREARHKALTILDAVGLLDLAGERASELPYGLRKMVDMSRALIGEPQLILLDEPSSGLDTSEQAIVQDVLRSLRDIRRVAAIVVEHHFDVVRATMDTIVALETGRIFLAGTPGEVLDSDEFRAAIVGRHGAVAAPRTKDAWTRS
jgi:ABC-type branched-subunit amino acid transport system ATPase component